MIIFLKIHPRIFYSDIERFSSNYLYWAEEQEQEECKLEKEHFQQFANEIEKAQEGVIVRLLPASIAVEVPQNNVAFSDDSVIIMKDNYRSITERKSLVEAFRVTFPNNKIMWMPTDVEVTMIK